MIEYRPFRNCNTPQIARLWNEQSYRRGLASHVSPRLLEEMVYSKIYFDHDGLILAWEGDQVLGFAHAAFGPDENEQDICCEMGAISMLLVAQREDAPTIARGLIEQCENYLRHRGAKLMYAGAVNPLNGFYLGLYGGSELPGVLASDGDLLGYYEDSGYREIDRCVVLQRDLTSRLEPTLDKRQRLVKRRYSVGINRLPQKTTWWGACTAPMTDTIRLELLPRKGGPPCGGLTLWTIEPLGRNWGAASAGLCGLEVPAELQRSGLATFLNVEAIKFLKTSGMGLVEAQTMQQNTAALGLYEKLGFQRVDQGIVLRKG